MNGEQLSFLEPIKKATGKREVYDATICYRCCCNKCSKFEMSNYYIELEARKRRRNFEIIDL